MRGPLTVSGDSLIVEPLYRLRQTSGWGCKSPKPVIISICVEELGVSHQNPHGLTTSNYILKLYPQKNF